MMTPFGMGLLEGVAVAACSGTGLLLLAWRRKQQQWKQALEENEALRQLNRRKDALLASTTHELRTPLNGMIGLAEALLDEIQGPINGEQEADLSMIVASGVRLNTLVDDILDYFKMKDHDLILNMTTFNPRRAVEEVLTVISPLLGNKQVKLVNRVPKDCPCVYGDEDRLIQILHNLVGNAVKYTVEGEVIISSTMKDNRLFLSIEDTGSGIAEDQLNHIFHSYTQSGSHSGRRGGSGLGLAVSKTLVELHGGAIEVQSKPGEGSIFTFSLAVSEDTESIEASRAMSHVVERPELALYQCERSSEPHPSVTAPDGDFHILAVDDDPAALQVLINHFSDWPYLVSTATSGEEALDIFRNEGVDLVLLDLMMDDLPGEEVCRIIRRTHPAHDLPVMFVTARNRVDDMLGCFDAEANDYLVKPVSRFELLSRVKIQLRMLALNRGLEEQIEQGKAVLETRNSQMRQTLCELNGRNEELETVEEMMRVINGEDSPETCLQTLVSQGVAMFENVDSGSVLLWNEERGRFEYVVCHGRDIHDLMDVVFTYDDLAGRRIRGLKQLDEGIFVIHDFPKSEPARMLEHLTRPQSIISLALKADGRTRGFLTLHSDSSNLNPGPPELGKLKRFRSNAMFILSKVLLYRELLDKTDQARGGEQYARHLQNAMTPDENFVAQIFPEHFILSTPGGTHSGDFHWFYWADEVAWVAVGECCDKGVAASVLSIISFRLLNTIVAEYGLDDPGKVMEELNLAILEAFKQDRETHSRSGQVKLALCRLDFRTSILHFSGACRPLFHVGLRSLNTALIEGCTQRLGEPGQGQFQTHKLNLEKGDAVYLGSDGFENMTDRNETRYGARRLSFMFRDLMALPFEKQKAELEREILNYCDPSARRDDITVFGFRM